MTDPFPRRAGQAARQSRPWLSWCGRALATLVIAAVVLAIGSVFVSPADQDPPDSGEILRTSTLATIGQLYSSTATLSGKTTGALNARLQSTRDTLAAQADALTVPSTTGTPTPTQGPAESMTTGAATASGTPSAPVSVPALVAALTSSATTARQDAVSATGAMARLLASISAGDLYSARTLATDAHLPVPGPSALAISPPAALAAPSVPPSSSVSPASPARCDVATPPGQAPSTDNALYASAVAEQRAVYAYEVAATRMTNPRSSQAVTLLAAHRQAFATLSKALADTCLQVPAPQPGFRLDPSFTAEPASALAALESQLSGIYADLIAYTAPEDVRTGTKSDKPVAAAGSERNWANARFQDSVLRTQWWGGSVSALPGIQK